MISRTPRSNRSSSRPTPAGDFLANGLCSNEVEQEKRRTHDRALKECQEENRRRIPERRKSVPVGSRREQQNRPPSNDNTPECLPKSKIRQPQIGKSSTRSTELLQRSMQSVYPAQYQRSPPSDRRTAPVTRGSSTGALGRRNYQREEQVESPISSLTGSDGAVQSYLSVLDTSKNRPDPLWSSGNGPEKQDWNQISSPHPERTASEVVPLQYIQSLQEQSAHQNIQALQDQSRQLQLLQLQINALHAQAQHSPHTPQRGYPIIPSPKPEEERLQLTDTCDQAMRSLCLISPQHYEPQRIAEGQQEVYERNESREWDGRREVREVERNDRELRRESEGRKEVRRESEGRRELRETPTRERRESRERMERESRETPIDERNEQNRTDRDVQTPQTPPSENLIISEARESRNEDFDQLREKLEVGMKNMEEMTRRKLEEFEKFILVMHKFTQDVESKSAKSEELRLLDRRTNRRRLFTCCLVVILFFALQQLCRWYRPAIFDFIEDNIVPGMRWYKN